MVEIPSDLRKNKETIVGNMNIRECTCLFLGLVLAISILYYVRVVLGYKRIVIAAFFAGIFVIPFLVIGFKKINGMKIDDYFKVFINNKIIANSNRLHVCQCVETKITNKKYEIIRHYKLSDKSEMIKLRQHLMDEKILILTEYIQYKNCCIVVFRIDGKDMILKQIKRNKDNIEQKMREKKELLKQKNTTNKDEINAKLKTLKLDRNYLKKKRFLDLKEEVDIFEKLKDIKAERILGRNISAKSRYSEKSEDAYEESDINTLHSMLQKDERELLQLNLFCKTRFRDFFKGINDKIIFINNENEIDLFFYNDSIGGSSKTSKVLIDTYLIDKNLGIYNDTILGLEARNYYNHYRKINSIGEIL